ncbi:30S ribosomal protein S9 [Candidatus Parcubacteria bacterium]|jgi:small subunit ribosomal protein S9|nr:MAG: 30S ribosomal protein S9 [Candidatus Parcubacteria bacterium]
MTTTKVKETTKSIKGTKYFEAVGRRKTAVARVRLFTGKFDKSEVLVNEKSFAKYFGTERLRKIVIDPFTTLSLDSYKVSVNVVGGGTTAQAEAIRLGISRTLIMLNPIWRANLKVLGFLKRDPRMVERKHPGLRKARRPQQWRKR